MLKKKVKVENANNDEAPRYRLSVFS